ncbi:hypothetical protein MRB53_006704 [Persea americana]|uniref:Uncharacterized protein n=1 Tax=Persea americana TaxID=3435 RepID=A0ACC2MH57_PERAE|nr:hypothetical protein MRB53_006704 [Persea americana]|eukprot:TRINITY_DN30778_c0_g1_i4.p1 TRINITY_DN30778_c0_g1~~TRINITY_DN30778_c0_g1_i4.p1  ORF type:complete len:906 (+),score=213.05 TRINITY_DN30778_c0_g1_i4:313-3030(+)
MLSKSFKAAKCKTSLKLAAARIKLLKQKKEEQLKQMKRELAQLLQTGQEQNARIRVENFFKEEKTVAAYNFVELYCELIAGRLPIIESQKKCPIDLKEAITSVIYASPRCADIPELQDVRKQFIAKYGKDFINSALELRPDCGVNHLVIEKLSTRTPDAETKIKILSMIAQEHNVKWDPAASKEQLLKPPQDLLNGPHDFTSCNKFHMESPDGQFGPPPSQKHGPSAKSFDNGVKSPPSSQSFSSSNTDSPTFSMPMASHPESRTSSITERKSGAEEFRYSFSKHGNASLKKQDWNMEFEDAASAAQAAAECADMASVAARAAAELSSHGYVTRQSSTESHVSSFHGSTNEVTRRSTSSKSIGEHVQHSGKKEDVSPRDSIRLKSKTHCWQNNEMEQDRWLGAAESRYDGHASIRRSSMSMYSQPSVISTDEETAVNNIQNLDRFSQVNSFESSERIAKTRVSSQSDDLLPKRFDELEGLTSDSEEENCNFRGKTMLLSLSHEKNVSTRSPASARMGRGLAKSAFCEKEKSEEVGRNTLSHASSDAELHVLDNSWKRHGVGYTPDRQGSGRLVKSPGKSNDLDMESSYSSISEEEDDLHPSKTSSAKEAETKNYMASQSPSTAGSEFSNYPSHGNGSMLNFGKLSGGLRNKTSSQKAYIRVHSTNASSTLKHEGKDEPLSISQKQTIFVSDNSTVSLGARNQRPFNQASPIKVNKGSSTISNTPSDLGGDNEGDFSQFQNVGSHQGVLLSRRSKNSRSKSNSEMPDSSVLGSQSGPSQENSSSAVESLPTTLNPAVDSRSRVNSISFQPSTVVEQPCEPHPQTRNSACKESSKSTANLAVENRSKTLPKSVVSGSSGMSKPLGVGGNSTSREGSLKNPSHVHPKLPDYDTLAAQFKALQTNQRSL